MNGIAHALMLLTIMVLGLGAANAAAATFRFEQAGFDDGGSLVGEFSGSDDNGDSRLTIETLPGGATGSGPPIVIASELATFTVRFTGNSSVAAFSLDLTSILQTQFGIPCCGPGEGYAFYFDLSDPQHLDFVAMAAGKIVLVVKESAFGSFSSVGEACNFTNGAGRCGASVGAAYAVRVSPVPLPPSLLLILPSVAALCLTRPRRGSIDDLS